MGRREGLLAVLWAAPRLAWSHAPGFLHLQWSLLLRRHYTVEFRGKDLPYLYDLYNRTSMTPRCIEAPIARELLLAARGRRVLEVGNVLSHYYAVEHEIIDKYEQAPNVRNEDILQFQPTGPYDLIISISTLEHVGWDEEPRDPAAAVRAARRLRSLLAPNGEALVTFALGDHPQLDELARGEPPFFAETRTYRRGAHGRWTPLTAGDLSDGALLVGVIRPGDS